MKKVIYAVAPLLFLAVATASAGDVLSGDDNASGSGASLTCQAIKGSNNNSLVYDPGMLVRTETEGAKPGFVSQVGSDGKNKFVLPVIPNGTKIYLFLLGDDWGDMARDVDTIDVKNAIASGTVTSGTASISLLYKDRKGNDFNVAMMNAIAVAPDNTKAWAGVEGTKFSVMGPNGPFLLVPKTCNVASEDTVKKAIAIESRK